MPTPVGVICGDDVPHSQAAVMTIPFPDAQMPIGGTNDCEDIRLAVLAWFASRQPVAWTEAEHAKVYWINLFDDREKALGKIASRLLKEKLGTQG